MGTTPLKFADLHPQPRELNLVPGFSTALLLLSKRIHFANLTAQ